jgi:hypothetical protein
MRKMHFATLKSVWRYSAIGGGQRWSRQRLEMRTSIIRSDIKEGSQRVVDYLVLVTARRDDIVEFCVAC